MIWIGKGLIILSGLSCLLALIYFGLAGFRDKRYQNSARILYDFFVIFVVAASLFFAIQIINHNFSLDYVFSYSSLDLGFFLLLSTFWAGQVGTFLLWLLFAAIIGLVLRRIRWEQNNRLLFFYLLTTVFLVTLLLAKSPFMPLDPHAHNIVLDRFPPLDGKGLNPLLQNFWMIIHPPIVFLGYALLAVPFVFALTALSANDYSSWHKKALPWSLFSLSILGMGIFLGGYWAYETLGWGGFWSWDPVENSSLIPWLTNLALVHGLILEKARGSLRKTNLVLALCGYLLVIYGTFLTRSGILQKFSVHSFTDLGINAYLIAFMAVFTLLSLVLFLRRVRRLPRIASAEGSPRWLETWIILGALFTILLAILTWIGTSAPLISTLVSKPANVTQSFYNTVALPIAIIMAILAAIASLYVYAVNQKAAFIKQVIISLIISLISIIVSYFWGVRLIQHFILIFASIFAICANILAVASLPKRTLFAVAGNLTHIGFGIILIGIIVSSAFSQNSGLIKLMGNKETQVLGMNCRFIGLGDDFFSPNNKAEIEIKSQSESFVARPSIYQDRYSGQSVINPFIQKSVFRDTYFAPQSYIPDYTTLILSKGDSNDAFGYQIKFNDFQMDQHDQSGGMRVGAILEVTKGGNKYTVIPYFSASQNVRGSEGAALIPGSDYRIFMNQIMADEGKIEIEVAGIGDLVLEISKKPLINLVWFGATIIVLGSLLAFFKRKKQATI